MFISCLSKLKKYLSFIYNYSNMDNYISCPITLFPDEYDRLLSRFLVFKVDKEETRTCEFIVYNNTSKRNQLPTKNIQTPKSNTRKFETPIVKIRYPQHSFIAFGKNTIEDKQFIFKSSLTMVQNSFENIFAESQIFSNLEQQVSFPLQIEIYKWQDMFQFQIYHFPFQNCQQCLLIMKDLNSILECDEKVREKKRDLLKTRIQNNFKEIYDTLLNNKKEHGNEDIFEQKSFDVKTKFFKSILQRIWQLESAPQFMGRLKKLQYFRSWMLNHMTIFRFYQKAKKIDKKNEGQNSYMQEIDEENKKS